MHDKLSRRSLLLGSSLLMGLPPEDLEAQKGETKLQYFDAETAAQIEALAEQILPADELGPGAKEAGVIYFIDRALATFDRDKRGLYTDGLDAARAAGTPVSIEKIEHTEFFETLRRHTIMGFLASPAWGGNRNQAGWKLIGFDDAHAYQPPFGYYDMPEHMK
jgi:gluconate 2-dehydrogenase gamma chain